MRYLVMVAAAFVLSVAQSVGQIATSIDEGDVPEKVMTAFNKTGSVENVDWVSENQHYIASYYDEKQSAYLQRYYDQNGKWIKTSKEVEENKLPASIKSNLDGLYGQDYTILLITAELSTDKVDYHVEIETTEGMFKLHFDKNGKLLAKAASVEDLDIIEEDED